LISIKLAWRPKIRWENDIKEYVRIMDINNWTKCMQGRVKWKEVVKKGKTYSEVIADEEEEEDDGEEVGGEGGGGEEEEGKGEEGEERRKRRRRHGN
jgi:hypothetical protein